MAEAKNLPRGDLPTGARQHGPATGHVVSVRILLGVWALLLVLTLLTVQTVISPWADFGSRMDLYIALAIATVKAALVLLYFMHLRYDSPLNAMWFIFALFFVALFIGGLIGDSQQYQSDLIPGYAPAMNP